jgi:hypothetical protein
MPTSKITTIIIDIQLRVVNDYSPHEAWQLKASGLISFRALPTRMRVSHTLATFKAGGGV